MAISNLTNTKWKPVRNTNYENCLKLNFTQTQNFKYSEHHLMGSWIMFFIGKCSQIQPNLQVLNNSFTPNVS